MKFWKSATFITLILCSAYVALAFRERQREVAALNSEIDQLRTALAQQTQRCAVLENQLVETRHQTLALENTSATVTAESAAVQPAAKRASQVFSSDAPQPADTDTNAQWLADANNPDVMRRLSTQARAQTLRHYDDFLQGLSLSPEQNEQLVKLLIEKKQASIDVAAASLAQGIDPRSDPAKYKAMIADTKNRIEDEIQTLLGDDNYARYVDYDRTNGQNSVVSNLSNVLRNTGTPLNANQAEQLRQTLQQHETSHINAKVIADSKNFLTPEQITALQDLRAVQKANSEKRNIPTQVLPTTPNPVAPAPKPVQP